MTTTTTPKASAAEWLEEEKLEEEDKWGDKSVTAEVGLPADQRRMEIFQFFVVRKKSLVREARKGKASGDKWW